MNIEPRYIKALVFSGALLIAVIAFKPSLPANNGQEQVDPNAVPPIAPQQSVIMPDGDLSDNYLSNALNAKGELVRWQNMPVYVYISDNPYKQTVEAAFNYYNNAFAGMLTFSFIDNPSQAQVKVNFPPRIENTNESQFVAGLTNNYNAGGFIQSSMINLLTQKNGSNLSANAVYNTALHEIGHAIGIEGHSQINTDVMYGQTSSTNPTPFSQRDMATIKIMYSNNDSLISQYKGNVGSQKLDEALRYAQSVPNKTVSWINLGNVYYDLKMLPEALEAYKKALNIDATDSNIYASMANCYYESKKYDTAASFYGYAIERTTDSVAVETFEYMKGLSLIQAQKFDDAYNIYQSLISKNPNKRDYMINYMFLCTKLNKVEGRNVLSSYFQSHPEERSNPGFAPYKQYYRL